MPIPASRSKSPKHSWQRRIRYFYLRLIRLDSTPEAIARGLAAGVFAGLFPLFGLQTLIGIAIALPLRGNKLMAAAGTWVSNPFTYLPIFVLNFQVGCWLLGTEQQFLGMTSLESWSALVELGSEFIVTLFLGCFVVGAIGAFCSYFLGLWLVRHSRKQRQRLS